MKLVKLSEQDVANQRKMVRDGLTYVTCVFIIHVGGTRGVTWSIDRVIQRHACTTWGVELILANVFHLFLVCLTDMTNTIARFFFNV